MIEIVQANLSGSLRLSHGKQKAVVYFRDGAVVYAASNSRNHRLFSILLHLKKIDQKTLSQYSNITNDTELAVALEENKVFTREELDEFTTAQVESIIVDALSWPNGEWHFSPLARVRNDLVCRTDVFKVLIDYARCMPSQVVYQRFKSVQEAFYRDPSPPKTSAVLQAHEKFALEAFNGSPLTIEELRPVCNLPESALIQSLYVLWLGGMLIRRDWNAAFNATKIGEIRSAKVSRIKEAVTVERKPEAESAVEQGEAEAVKLPELDLSLEDYLARIEGAETLYDSLGVATNCALSEIKNAYFAMAKLFHPDRYHREDPVRLRRIQIAFTQIAHAYETLKTKEGREGYDFKMRKELEIREKRRAAAAADPSAAPVDRQAEQGLESFEKGLEALNDEEFAAAAGHLSRAVHYSPQNALYHAYFGQALSYLDKQHHKAESSLQTAVKLDPKNPKIRMMLVQFFIDIKMAKRAEGELKRFLELVPGNPEATKLLAKLQPKEQV